MSTTNLGEICQFIAADLDAIESKLLEKTTSHYDFVDLAVQHVIEGGGKRLRPILLVLSAKACGYDGADAHTLAAVTELIHVASLVHDDVLDEAPIRRGHETLHSKWGNKVAVLVGDYLHARVLSMLVARRADDAAMRILSDTTQAMCEGEVIHAYKNGDFNVSQDDYLKIIGLKTGKLIAASCEMGAMLGSDDSETIQAFTDYGESIGNAFQIIDDLLDLVSDETKLGKESFNDLREGKLTFPIIYTRGVCTSDEKGTLEQVFSTDADEDWAIDWITKLLRQYRVQEYCLQIAQEYADRAKAALIGLPNTPAKTALGQLADYVVSRDR